jgi:hypothetical protein
MKRAILKGPRSLSAERRITPGFVSGRIPFNDAYGPSSRRCRYSTSTTTLGRTHCGGVSGSSRKSSRNSGTLRNGHVFPPGRIQLFKNRSARVIRQTVAAESRVHEVPLAIVLAENQRAEAALQSPYDHVTGRPQDQPGKQQDRDHRVAITSFASQLGRRAETRHGPTEIRPWRGKGETRHAGT